MAANIVKKYKVTTTDIRGDQDVVIFEGAWQTLGSMAAWLLDFDNTKDIKIEVCKDGQYTK